jgi:hypothetical protein
MHYHIQTLCDVFPLRIGRFVYSLFLFCSNKKEEMIKMTAIVLNGVQMKTVFNGIWMRPEYAESDDNFTSSRHYRRVSVELTSG